MKNREHDYQIAAFDANGTLVHCGVHGIGRLSRRTIVKLERKWLAWRTKYQAEHMDHGSLFGIPRVTQVSACPVDSPSKCKMFAI